MVMIDKITDIGLCIIVITSAIFLICCVVCFAYSMFKLLVV